MIVRFKKARTFCAVAMLFIATPLVANASSEVYKAQWSAAGNIVYKYCPGLIDDSLKLQARNLRMEDPDEIATNISLGNRGLRCAKKLPGSNKGYVMLWALDHFSATNYSSDEVQRHDGNARQKSLIESALQIPRLPSALRTAFQEAEDDLL